MEKAREREREGGSSEVEAPADLEAQMAMGQGEFRLWHIYRTGFDKSQAFWYNSQTGTRLSYATLAPQQQFGSATISWPQPHATTGYSTRRVPESTLTRVLQGSLGSNSP